jgi:hypothetical protein
MKRFFCFFFLFIFPFLIVNLVYSATKIITGPTTATTARAAVRWKDTSQFKVTNSLVLIDDGGTISGVATQAMIRFDTGDIYLTNGVIFLQHASAPTAGDIGGTVGVTTNHLIRNVMGNLTNYWSDGTTLWSKRLAP